ncbi:MAG: LCP family protein [Actinomycetia bacterium]|nr:LCP family protein [Actinomycetes bacterium]
MSDYSQTVSDTGERTPSGSGRSGKHRQQKSRRARPKPARTLKKKEIIAVAAVLGTLVVGVLAFLAYEYFSVGAKLAPARVERKAIEAVLDDAPALGDPNSGYSYILLLGNDSTSGNTRTDTILLARLSSADKSVLLLSIPRDTRTEVPGHGVTKVNHASAYGGVPLTIETVQKLTGLPVNHYVQVDFVGFASIVDALGGIDMYVDRPVDYGQGIIVGTGMQHLNGAKALSVVRNRQAYSNGDFGRIKTQQAFLSAVARKAAAERNFSRLTSVMNAGANHVKTDMSVADIVALFGEYRGAASKEIPSYTIPATTGTISGVSYVIPKAEEMKALLEAIQRGEFPSEE